MIKSLGNKRLVMTKDESIFMEHSLALSRFLQWATRALSVQERDGRLKSLLVSEEKVFALSRIYSTSWMRKT